MAMVRQHVFASHNNFAVPFIPVDPSHRCSYCYRPSEHEKYECTHTLATCSTFGVCDREKLHQCVH